MRQTRDSIGFAFNIIFKVFNSSAGVIILNIKIMSPLINNHIIFFCFYVIIR